MHNYIKYKSKNQIVYDIKETMENENNEKIYILDNDIKIICKDKKYLCNDANSSYAGLCVENEEICKDLLYDKNKANIPRYDFRSDPDLMNKYEIGVSKGYVDDYLNNSCLGELTNIYDWKHSNLEHKIPNEFSIITLNVMGIYNTRKADLPKLNLLKLRAKKLANELIMINADILCFQEMTKTFLDELYENAKFSKMYPYYRFYDEIMDSIKDKNCEPIIISKLQPIQIIQKPLGGVLNYTNSLAIIEFDNLVVFNCYFQAGSKASPGQLYKWIHYSRCRKQLFEFIKNIMNSSEYKMKQKIVLGDFNFDLNGQMEDWPEIIEMQNLNLKDSWINANVNLDPKIGSTENTDKNTMRWNSKFEAKMFRYDAILYSDKLDVIKSDVAFDNPDELKGEQNVWYENTILPNNYKEYLSQIKRKPNGNYDLFISDHFGVISRFRFMP